jgi:hypothetical protein
VRTVCTPLAEVRSRRPLPPFTMCLGVDQ